MRELINTNNFKDLYGEAFDVLANRCIAELTQVFYAADVDPLRYLDYIPEAFLAYSDVTSFAIPDHIERIERIAFHDCTKLVAITIPDSVKEIGADAFSFCSGLTSIESYAFERCHSLVSVTIESNVAKIAFESFAGCTKLRKINYNGTVDQWKKIDIDEDNKKLRGCKIICSDGTLKWNKEAGEWVRI